MADTFDDILNRIRNPIIKDNVKIAFPGDMDAARIAEVVDKVIGGRLDDFDQTFKNINNRLGRHSAVLVLICAKLGIELPKDLKKDLEKDLDDEKDD